jgi:Fe-S cluster assembly protein SufD
MTSIAHELVEAAVDRLPVDALTPARKVALAQFAISGFPTVKDEDWKYTNLSAAIELSNACLATASGSESKASWTAEAKRAIDDVLENLDANWIIIANGITALETLANAESLEAEGIHISRLSSGRADSEIISDDSLTSFNAALLQDGLQVRIRPSAYESALTR